MKTTRGGHRSATETLGHLDAPAPIRELIAARWDVVVVGAGHNGLTCGPTSPGRAVGSWSWRRGSRLGRLYTPRGLAGTSDLALCLPGRTPPRDGHRGVRDGRVRVPLDAGTRGLFVPFEDGTSVQLWDDDDLCEEEVGRLAPGDLRGWRAFSDVKRRLRDALRPSGAGDLWIGRPPSRDEIERRLGDDAEARRLLFEWSMVEYVEHYFDDERLQSAYLGQGVIGTFASPHDPGTASIHFHHQSGRLGGMPGMWGYVDGGMGMVSFILGDIARDAGAVVLTGTPVARIIPGVGVELAGGERILSPCVVSNADPRTTLRLLGDEVDSAWRTRVEEIPQVGCTVKLNVALRELPSFTARPGTRMIHHQGQINTPLSKEGWQSSYMDAREGELPDRLWTELYFQTAHDATVAPEGMHTMSVFAQYVPHTFARGQLGQSSRGCPGSRPRSIARFCDNMPEAVIDVQVLGPPDIEREVGLIGGHIFQGECLPRTCGTSGSGLGLRCRASSFAGHALTPAVASSRSTDAMPRWRSWRGPVPT